jgi:hypothetical protein
MMGRSSGGMLSETNIRRIRSQRRFLETVSGKPDPAIRIFAGDTAGKEVGDRFDSYHKVNHMPCGVWTVIAVAETGRLTSGQLPAGTRKLRVNELG